MKRKILLNICLLFAACSFTMAQNTDTTDEGAIINGVKWATRNIDAPGTFAASPEDAGMFYQWNRTTAWPVTDDVEDWNSSYFLSPAWKELNDPSPDGWRVPTDAEIQSLLDTANVRSEWTTENGINGRRFIDRATGNSIFLPAAGHRHHSRGTLTYSGSFGYYWSNTPHEGFDKYTYYLNLGRGTPVRGNTRPSCGLSVRCVTDF
jgi:uncharacterized protein (TIGR02145 family)